MSKPLKIGFIVLCVIVAILLVILITKNLRNRNQKNEIMSDTQKSEETSLIKLEPDLPTGTLLRATISPPVQVFEPDGRQTFVLSPNACKHLLSNSPKEFMDSDSLLYDSCEDFRKHAYIDKEGNLVLSLSREQKDAWLSFWGGYDEEQFRELGLTTSNGYAECLFKGYSEDVSRLLPNIIVVLEILQLYSGISPDDIYIHWVMIDAGTNEVVVNQLTPPGKIIYSPGWFTSKPTE